MHLFGRRCIVTTRREARQIQAVLTAKSEFGTVRQAQTFPKRRPSHHRQSRAPLRVERQGKGAR